MSAAVSGGKTTVWGGHGVGFALPERAWCSEWERSSAMASAPPDAGVFGPFDGDFDPFEDEEAARVLIPLD